MKLKYIVALLLGMTCQFTFACEACKKQQPRITQGITHGAGPASNWDWLIVAIVAVIAIVSLLFSFKYLIHPGEKNADHIKKIILRQ